eukprot:2986995-Rhodomonas_salina.1
MRAAQMLGHEFAQMLSDMQRSEEKESGPRLELRDARTQTHTRASEEETADADAPGRRSRASGGSAGEVLGALDTLSDSALRSCPRGLSHTPPAHPPRTHHAPCQRLEARRWEGGQDCGERET